MQEVDAPLYFWASSKYSRAISSKSWIFPENKAGFYKRASALITP